MTSSTRAVFLAVLVVGSALAAPVAGAAAGDGASSGASVAGPDPAVTVSIGSTAVDPGGYYERGRDPRLTIEAVAQSGSRLDEIIVRADGTRQASRDVNGTEVTEKITPDLDDGNNTVRVIVTDEAGNVNSTQFTVFKDGSPPEMFLTSPYETRPWYSIDDGNTTGSNTTLAGEILDESEIDRFSVSFDYGGQSHSQTFEDPGKNFSVPLFLGYHAGDGEVNSVTLTAMDEWGHTRVQTFEITVNDGSDPEIHLDPYPDEMTGESLPLSGTLSDDVWVESATVEVSHVDENETRTTQIVGPSKYERDPGRTSVDFEHDLWLPDLGEYEVTVRASDAAGANVSESFTVERKSSIQSSPDPDIQFDRERTVVLGSDTLFLSGVAFEGKIGRVTVETRRSETGETVDYQTIHAGEVTDRVEFDREVGISSALTTVIVRVTDSEGEEHTKRFYVNGSSKSSFVGRDAQATDDAPETTVEVTPMDDGRPGTASSTVTVENAITNERIGIPSDDGREALAGTANVTLERMYVSANRDADFTLGVTTRERAGAPLTAPAGATGVGTATIQHSIAGDTVEEVTLVFRVNRSYLDAQGVAPDDVSAARLSDGEWSDVDLTRIDGAGGAVRYRVESPGLSVFSLTSGDAALDGSDAGGDASDGNDGSGNETGDNSTDGGDGGTAGEARLLVSNVTVNQTSVGVNESVRVNATIRNSGDAEGSYTAVLQTIEGLNRSTVGERSVAVPAGEERTVSYETSFAESGTYNVTVNGTRAGPIEVGGGGLLSVLSIVPVKLLGLIGGAIVGVVALYFLVRFALRKLVEKKTGKDPAA